MTLSQDSPSRSALSGIGRVGACVAILITTMMAIFGQVRGFEFLLWDDPVIVSRNPLLNPPSWENLKALWSEPHHLHYVPVAFTVFWLEALLHELIPAIAPNEGTLSPTVFHLGNLVLHTLCVLLVYAILRVIVEQDMAAVAGALLFGLHPLQCEPIGWITETRGLSSAALGLVAVWLFLICARSANNAPRWGPTLGMIAATVVFILSLLAKPTAVVFPLITIIVVAGWNPALLRRTLIWQLGWMVAGFACVIGAKMLQPDEAIRSLTPIWTRPLIAGDALAFYLFKTALPWHLGVDYGRTPPEVMGDLWPYLAWLVPCAVVAVLWRLPHRRWWLTAFAVYAAGLLPLLGLLPFRFQDFSTVADRYVYVAMLGPSLAVAWIVVAHRRPVVMAGMAGVLTALAVVSFNQIGYWRNNHTLFQHALVVHPASHLAHTQLGKAEEVAGDFNSAAQHYVQAINLNSDAIIARNNLARLLSNSGRYEEAIEHYRHVLHYSPDLVAVKSNMAFALARNGQRKEAHQLYEELLAANPTYVQGLLNYAELLREEENLELAAEQYRHVLEMKPNHVAALVNLGNVLTVLGDVDGAAQQYQAAIQLKPQDPGIVASFGLLLLIDGRADEAVPLLRRAIALQPNAVGVRYRLGEALAAQGKDAEAAEIFRGTLRMRPGWVDAKRALAWLLATSRDDEVRDGEQAVRFARDACVATGFDKAEALDTLAAAYAETGEYEKAISTATSARQIAARMDDRALIVEIDKRLDLYRAGNPYRSR